MKQRNTDSGRRKNLAAISSSTLGGFEGIVEPAGLYRPTIKLA